MANYQWTYTIIEKLFVYKEPGAAQTTWANMPNKAQSTSVAFSPIKYGFDPNNILINIRRPYVREHLLPNVGLQTVCNILEARESTDLRFSPRCRQNATVPKL